MTASDPAGPQADPTHEEQIGSVAEEAFKLFRALAASSTSEEPFDSAGDHGDAGTHICTTTWCPICQIVGYVRENPAAVENLSQAAMACARSLRDMLDAIVTPRDEA